MIPADVLASMRAIAETARPDTATIQRLTETVDNIGGFTNGYATAATVSCRITRLMSKEDEVLFGNRASGRVTFTAFFPHDVDLRPTDRVVVTYAGGASPTTTYEVVGVRAPTSDQVHVRALLVVRS